MTFELVVKSILVTNRVRVFRVKKNHMIGNWMLLPDKQKSKEFVSNFKGSILISAFDDLYWLK